ncbi:hypothetical protein [Actinosynnema mirum]|uniref:Uncharacterized protein n=1 Tax=Actinosynnema mirum (strain ATCC 29888 / DSM 43827 / JCM 3225 / NBRC 14064 / NCIMB 13271 / NRRL B-12336 / IMRU 3971 / 101) TaxID=446462 RepID=C6WNF8_ACTMD|nr:hypothetical protein [Actinosynnema mirum]ACU40522.1 hypothetical protein Amir_6725 [Actinosynnema mirum DSM 43827]
MTTPDPHGSQGRPPQGYPQGGYPQAGAPQQGYPQAGHPSFPAANPMAEGEPTPRPKSVDLAFLLWMVSAALSVLKLVFSYLTIDAVNAETAARLTGAGLPVEPSDIDGSLGLAGTALMLVFTAAWAAVAFAMRGGANWARIVLTVFGGLSLAFGLLGSLIAVPVLFSIGALGVVEALVNIADIPVLIAAIVYMFTGGAGRYFATR